MPDRLAGVRYPPDAEIEGYRACGAWSSQTVADALRHTARRAPDAPALVSGGRRLTYAQYDDLSERLGAALLQCGLEPRDRIMFQMGNTIDTAVTLLACFKSGLIPVCTLPQHRELEIGGISRQTEARGYIVQPAASRNFDLLAMARKIMRGHPSLRHLIAAGEDTGDGVTGLDALIGAMTCEQARDRLAAISIGPDDVMAFQLSGGTTGTPKVIPRMHGEYLAYCQAWIDLVGLGGDDAALWALPLIHNAAMIYHLVPALMQGRKLVLMERFDVVEFLATIERERIAITGSIGPVASMILDYPHVAAHDLSSIKLFTTLDRADAIEAHLKVPVANVYGISEGLLTASAPGDPAAARHGTVGRPVSPFDRFRLLAGDGETDVRDGAVGEFAFKGPSSMRGYYRDDQARFTSDGYFRSGDLMSAHVHDGTRFLRFEGRIKDNIDRGGEKFGPEEVEGVIVRHPAVADARVVAMPHPVYGEAACAFLIAQSGQTLPDVGSLADFMQGQGLARFKIPERIEPIGAFPETRVGKVDRAALRRLIAEKIEAENSMADQRQTL